MQIGGAQTATYTYDAFGQRFGKTLAASSSLFQYDQAGHLLEEAANTGALKTDTLYLNGAPIADVTPSALFYLHTDRLGTPQVATTTAGAVAWRAAYQAFGFNTGASGLLTQNLRFPGQYADAETGDYQNGARDYDPTLGRYLETDRIGLLGGINTFAYASSNPIGTIDRTGLCPPCIVAAVEGVEALVEAAEAGEVVAEASEAATAAEQARAAAVVEGTAVAIDELAKATAHSAPSSARQCDPSKRFSPAKQALVDMAKGDKRTGMTPGDMQAYKDLNKELPDPFGDDQVRGPEAHDSGAPTSQAPH